MDLELMTLGQLIILLLGTRLVHLRQLTEVVTHAEETNH